MTAPHLGPGHNVAGRYTIRALLGFTGEVATYYAASGTGQEVVVKLFDPAIGQRADVMTSLERVRGLVAAMPQDLVVPMFDFGYDAGTGAPFVASEYLQVPSLAKLVENGPLSPEVVAAIVTGLARVLDTAHGMQLHHHALKPTNIFVGPAPNYQVRLTDFGASVVRSTSPTHEAYARSAPWWAPEQLQPAAVLGAATDVFAAALVAFHALTARSYWMSCQVNPPDLPQWQMEVMGQRVPVSQRAQQLGTVVNPIVDGAMARALSVNQPERPQSVGELAGVLASTVAGAGPGGPRTMALPEMSQPPSAGYAPPPAFGGQPAAAAGAVSSDGHYVATAGPPQEPPANTEQQLTPGLPPFPQPKKKQKGSMVPVIVGVIAAVLLGGAGVTFLFMRSSGDDESASAAASASASSDSAAGEGGGAAAASTSGAAGGSADDGGAGGAAAEPEKVRVTIKCLPECDAVIVDGDKVDGASEGLNLLPGKHTLELTKAGYLPRKEIIDVEIGAPVEKEYPLQKPGPRPKPKPKPCGQFLKPCK